MKNNKFIKNIILYGCICIANAQNETISIDSFLEDNNPSLNNSEKRGIISDPYLSEVNSPKTNSSIHDSQSLSATLFKQAESQRLKELAKQKELNRSLRLDLIQGQRPDILIAEDHFVKLAFLYENEIVYPTNLIAGNENILNIIYESEKSPYIYISSKISTENLVTTLFIETNEENKVQTYPIRVVVTNPSNITDQITLNLVGDQTPPTKGEIGSQEYLEANKTKLQEAINQSVVSNAGSGEFAWDLNGQTVKFGGPDSGHNSRKFSRDDVRRYFDTMVAITKAYDTAKKIERDKGRITYTDRDVIKGKMGLASYKDPVTGDIWSNRPWYFPKFDAIIVEATQYNPTEAHSGWNYTLMNWTIGKAIDKGNFPLKTTAVKPASPVALAKKNNKIWYLLQGANITEKNQFIPNFPPQEIRKNNFQ